MPLFSCHPFRHYNETLAIYHCRPSPFLLRAFYLVAFLFCTPHRLYTHTFAHTHTALCLCPFACLFTCPLHLPRIFVLYFLSFLFCLSFFLFNKTKQNRHVPSLPVFLCGVHQADRRDIGKHDSGQDTLGHEKRPFKLHMHCPFSFNLHSLHLLTCIYVNPLSPTLYLSPSVIIWPFPPRTCMPWLRSARCCMACFFCCQPA